MHENKVVCLKYVKRHLVEIFDISKQFYDITNKWIWGLNLCEMFGSAYILMSKGKLMVLILNLLKPSNLYYKQWCKFFEFTLK